MDNTNLNSSFYSNNSHSFNHQFGHASELAYSIFGRKDSPVMVNTSFNITLLDKVPKPETKCTTVKKLLCHRVFMCIVLSMSALYFVVSGVQFWLTQYTNLVLKVDLETVNKFFTVTCLTAPLSGVLLGILIFNCIGGYATSRALDLVLLFGVCACVVTLPIPFLGPANVAFFCILMWLLFFFGSIILAPMVGIMLN